MRVVSKGVFQFFLARFCLQIFESNLLEVADGPWEVVVQTSVMKLRALLFTWYGQEAKAGRVRTQVQNLVPNMFGSRDNPSFDLHASETNHFLHFVSTLLDRFGERLPNLAFWRSGLDALLDLTAIYNQYQYTNLPDDQIQRLCNSVVQHLRACKRLRISSKPKHHFLMELAIRVRITGSLALSATWNDEGLNKIIKAVGQTAHRLNWTLRVLDEFEALHRLGKIPGARKRARAV